MEPRVQYAKTSDGVSIAFSVNGSGVPVLFSFPVADLTYTRESPVWRTWYEGMARRFQFINYDSRGSGLSQRGVNLTPEAMALDLEAVVDQLALNSFFVFGGMGYGHGAIHYAAAHPERIAGLILWDTFVSGKSALDREWFVDLAKRDWELFLRSTAQTFNWLDPSEVRDYLEVMKKTTTQDDYVAFAEAVAASDVSPLLPSVQTPTLVLHPRDTDFSSVEEAMRLTSMLPNAQLVLLEGARFIPVGELVAPTQAAMAEFIDGITGQKDQGQDSALPSGTATILFADIVESTALTEKIGDTAFREKARELDEALRKIVRQVDGTPVEGKLLGDGVLSVFSSAKNAIDAALKFGDAGKTVGLQLHLGIHAGDVIREGDNVFGGAVNIAARISSESEAGEVLVSQTVRDLARTSAGVKFDDRGERELKGVGEPVRLYAVGEDD